MVEHCKHTSMCSHSVTVFFLPSAATHPLKYARLFSVLFPLYVASTSGILSSVWPSVKQLINIFSSLLLFFNTDPGVGFMLLVPQHRTETLLFIPIGCVIMSYLAIHYVNCIYLVNHNYCKDYL